jgi:hypothetical protein
VTTMLELAHGALRAVPTDALSGVETFALVRVTAEDPRTGRRAWVAHPAVTRLGDARSEWRFEALPALVAGLVEVRLGGGFAGPQLEAHVPAEVQEQLRRLAPRTWQLLVQHTKLLQRDESFQLELRAGALHLRFRPAGADPAQTLASPLLELAAVLRAGPPGAPQSQSSWSAVGAAEARALLVEWLRARWLHRRLPPGLRWLAPEDQFALRRSSSEPRLRERRNGDGVPTSLELTSRDLTAPLDLDVAPGTAVPFDVARAGLGWLLDPSRAETMLFLDGAGRFPRERAQAGPGL